MTQEALKLALALVTMHHTDDGYAELRSKLAKEALAQPEQEPVADDFFRMIADKNPKHFPLPQRTWVGLTDEEVRKICVNEWGGYEQCRAIENKLKEKNT